eukprot:15195823-Alexandrium_andersonii.AAC.1
MFWPAVAVASPLAVHLHAAWPCMMFFAYRACCLGCAMHFWRHAGCAKWVALAVVARRKLHTRCVRC